MCFSQRRHDLFTINKIYGEEPYRRTDNDKVYTILHLGLFKLLQNIQVFAYCPWCIVYFDSAKAICYLFGLIIATGTFCVFASFSTCYVGISRAFEML